MLNPTRRPNLQIDILCVTGQMGSGKSTLAEGLYLGAARALFFGVDDDPAPSDVHVQSIAGLIAHLEKIHAFEDQTVPFHLFYVPRSNEYDLCCRLAMTVGFNATFLDECDRFGDPKRQYWFDELVTRGRRRGVATCAIATNPIKIPPDVRRQSTRIICFYQNHSDDVEAFQELMGDAALEIPQLQQFEVIEWEKFKGARRYFPNHEIRP